MLNEFTDLELECMNNPNPKLSCDPLGDFDSPMNLEDSIYAMIIIWVVTYFIAFLIMKRLSTKYE